MKLVKKSLNIIAWLAALCVAIIVMFASGIMGVVAFMASTDDYKGWLENDGLRVLAFVGGMIICAASAGAVCMIVTEPKRRRDNKRQKEQQLANAQRVRKEANAAWRTGYTPDRYAPPQPPRQGVANPDWTPPPWTSPWGASWNRNQARKE